MKEMIRMTGRALHATQIVADRLDEETGDETVTESVWCDHANAYDLAALLNSEVELKIESITVFQMIFGNWYQEPSAQQFVVRLESFMNSMLLHHQLPLDYTKVAAEC
jgi:hypothetical protein